MINEVWELNQVNPITFVLVNAAYTEVAGLGNTFTLEISKNTAAFQASAGTKGEIGSGWYYYLPTAGEADTRGPISIRITGAGIIQQNLEYVVGNRVAGCSEFTYTFEDNASNPIAGAVIWFSTDVAGSNIVWTGISDAFGVARDPYGNLPCLDPGTYSVWAHKPGIETQSWPDTEVVT